MQILDPNQPLDGVAFVLSADSGLVGSPAIDRKGIVHAKPLLVPGLLPGGKVLFKTKANIAGGYRIETTNWYADMQLRKYTYCSFLRPSDLRVTEKAPALVRPPCAARAPLVVRHDVKLQSEPVRRGVFIELQDVVAFFARH